MKDWTFRNRCYKILIFSNQAYTKTENILIKNRNKNYNLDKRTKKRYLAIKYQIEHQLFVDYDVMEKILVHTDKNEIRVKSFKYNSILNEAPFF